MQAKQTWSASPSNKETAQVARILIVDDEPQMRDLLAQILRTSGHVIAEAGGGAEAQRMMFSAQYDAVITDLIMPKGNGFDLIECCRVLSRETKVIAMSARGNPALDYLRYALTIGAHFAFHKDSDLFSTLVDIERVLAGETVSVEPAEKRVAWPSELMAA
jgi:DNA-binding NtrC family response regulator